MSGNIYAAIAVAAVQGIMTYSKLKAQKDAYKNQAQIAEYNATTADMQARGAIESGRNAVTDYQRNVGAFKSSQINGLAENGIDVTQGSAIDILASTEMMAQADIDNIKYNAALESWGHQVERTNYRNQANAYRAQAKSVRPLFNSFMKAGEQFASMYGGGTPSGNPMDGGQSSTATPAYEMNSGNQYKTWSGAEGYSNTSSPSWQNYNWNWFGSAA